MDKVAYIYNLWPGLVPFYTQDCLAPFSTTLFNHVTVFPPSVVTRMSVTVQDEDLETDLHKLRLRPDPDRPKELLPQYSRLCPELSHDFQVQMCLCVCCVN